MFFGAIKSLPYFYKDRLEAINLMLPTMLRELTEKLQGGGETVFLMLADGAYIGHKTAKA